MQQEPKTTSFFLFCPFSTLCWHVCLKKGLRIQSLTTTQVLKNEFGNLACWEEIHWYLAHSFCSHWSHCLCCRTYRSPLLLAESHQHRCNYCRSPQHLQLAATAGFRATSRKWLHFFPQKCFLLTERNSSLVGKETKKKCGFQASESHSRGER